VAEACLAADLLSLTMRNGLAWLLTVPATRRAISISRTSVPRCTDVHFACPTCQEDLLQTGSGLRCSKGHLVNVAKEGHVHLSPPTKLNKAVVAELDGITRSQRAFYELGGYSAQADELAAECVRALSLCPEAAEDRRLQVLNADCGEGFWLRRLARELEESGPAISVGGLWGTDASKLAVRYAAKRQAGATFAVCSPSRLPFADGVFDLVVSTFGSATPWDEFCRVLRPGGAVIVARAGRRHLEQIREAMGIAEEGPPKQFSAGLAENYVRSCTTERYSLEQCECLLGTMPVRRRKKQPRGRRATADGDDDRLQEQEEPKARLVELLTSTGSGCVMTVDVIISTHRVWLGTGGEPI
jgi:SAM-dependent methyltransferase